jgi:lysophospholipase L1-like esterase
VGKRLVACVGASIVHGNVSFNFVNLLKDRLEPKGFELVNAGVNGDLAWNVLKRLDSIIKLQPNYVIILVGTNDVIATTSRGAEITYKLTKRPPKKPTLDFYRESLESIVSDLQKRTNAKIALSSLPVLGEDLSSEPNQKIAKYNNAIRETTEKYGLTYLPVNESQVELLHSLQKKRGRAFKGGGLMTRAILRHRFLGQSLDEISERNGLLLTIECIHMNTGGGTIIADQIEAFLNS